MTVGAWSKWNIGEFMSLLVLDQSIVPNFYE